MNRRALLALLPALAAAGFAAPAIAQTPPALSPQDQADIARVQTYLNGIRTLKAQFLQIAPDGSTSGGTAWLDRPGRMRFQYDPPTRLLLVAGHGLLVYHDYQLDQTTNLFLSATPLGLLLQANLQLSGDVTVTRVQRDPGQIQLTLVRTKNPGQGSLTLVFADHPLALRQWIVLDAQGRQTRVSLYNAELGGTFKQSLFKYVPPLNTGGGNG